MQSLSPRHVKTEESLRLGVVSGWYSTKVSGTFVSGPHDSEADCLRRIAEIDPPPVKARPPTKGFVNRQQKQFYLIRICFTLAKIAAAAALALLILSRF